MARSGRSSMLAAWLAALAGGALGQAACGGDDEGSGGTHTSTAGAGGEGGSSSTGSGTGGSGGTTSTGSGTGGSGGNLCDYTGQGECAPGEEWEQDPNDPCVCCVIQYCEAEGNACCNEPGCMAIVDCVRTSGCSGLACLGPCGTVINQNGGLTGAPLAAASALGDCLEVPCGNCDGAGGSG